MSETNPISRRDLLRSIGASVLAAGCSAGMSLEAAQHVHQMVAEEKAASGAYQPKVFTAHEYATLERLAALIIPSDEHSKGALEAGAPAFIDLLASHNEDLATIYTGGIAWLDDQMMKRYSASFIEASPAGQTAVLDLIAYKKNSTPELAPGIRFFDWARRLTVDAFYTSKIGIADLGYLGNTAVSEFKVPQAAIEYALRRSGLD
jgi:gluconate 2-dehydrogenase gamma chain